MYLKYNEVLLHEKIHINFWALKLISDGIWKRDVKSLLSRMGKACYAIRNMGNIKSYSNLTTLTDTPSKTSYLPNRHELPPFPWVPLSQTTDGRWPIS
jgi:hypothetical protein